MIAEKRLLMILMIGCVSMFFPVQAATYTIAVNANTKTGSWNRFYERGVASDHMHTVLSTAYGRGIKHAMKLAVLNILGATVFWTMMMRYIPKTPAAMQYTHGPVSTGSTIQSLLRG